MAKHQHSWKRLDRKSIFPLCGVIALALNLSACNTLPKFQPQPLVHASDINTSQTHLAKLIEPLETANPNLTGYHVLYDPLEAISARLDLINKAEKTLDLQYYIWDNDNIGALALHNIIQAADRGVKVRLLIDDNNAKKMEGIFLALDQHQNIQVKLYNPYRFRNFRAMDMLLDLKRINRRMHNKSFIVDHQVALIGGRNMSNQYYNASNNYQFSDIDVLLVGQAVNDISTSFDDYWNDRYAYPVRQIVNSQRHQLRYASLKQQLDAHYKKITVQNYLNLANHSRDFDTWLNKSIEFDWVKAVVVKDSPNKIRDQATAPEYLNTQLSQYVEKPQHNLDIISAYFVPEKNGTKMLSDLAKKGVEVRVLTNSFKANDVWLVHAFYSKYRPELLQSGVKLYEFLPTLDNLALNPETPKIAKETKLSLKGLSRSSLHAKMMTIDDKQVFIGSFNLDPRSARLNTEIGVLLNSPSLASAIHTTMNNDLSKYSYQLQLSPQQNIQWLRTTPPPEQIYNKEPKMKWWQKAGLQFISWLPIEGMM
ncbi:phospholipase D family protein [Acinetobacter sp. MD2(2019)]|uniref:phospholipase D family protein n=1 Tax=Acinetobacter sp. MD2(2019) TaxID=2605273 RepID=UPI002D1ED3CB|nr:phospholipase D family protein [Acinetobacter sp. MD2(2019)]MEB3754540.1 phospholipase D family protein [Acinetobacter sp. MD2(2019)]